MHQHTHSHIHTCMSRRCVCTSWEMMRISSVRWGTDGVWLCSLRLRHSSFFHHGRPCVTQSPEARTVSEDTSITGSLRCSPQKCRKRFGFFKSLHLHCAISLWWIKTGIYIFLHKYLANQCPHTGNILQYVLYGTVFGLIWRHVSLILHAEVGWWVIERTSQAEKTDNINKPIIFFASFKNFWLWLRNVKLVVARLVEMRRGLLRFVGLISF